MDIKEYYVSKGRTKYDERVKNSLNLVSDRTSPTHLEQLAYYYASEGAWLGASALLDMSIRNADGNIFSMSGSVLIDLRDMLATFDKKLYIRSDAREFADSLIAGEKGFDIPYASRYWHDRGIQSASTMLRILDANATLFLLDKIQGGYHHTSTFITKRGINSTHDTIEDITLPMMGTMFATGKGYGWDTDKEVMCWQSGGSLTYDDIPKQLSRLLFIQDNLLHYKKL